MGYLWMIISCFFYALMGVFVKLASGAFSSYELIAARGLFAETGKLKLEMVIPKPFDPRVVPRVARRVAEASDKTLAAIASADTAELYGLQVLMRDINTDGDNTTRFIVVGKELPKRGNRFSLLFTVDHKAGALARVIQAIAAAGFNMECIKSRPMPHVPFEYYFYVELVGAADAPDAKRLLAGLESVCRTVRVLGIYTRKGETV